jgi:hypothetical protein
VAIQRLNKTFVDGEVWDSTDINPISQKIDETIDQVNLNTDEIVTARNGEVDLNTRINLAESSAGVSATNAANSAAAAATSEANAANSASAAATSESNALSYKNTAETAKNNALTYSNDSYGWANTAENTQFTDSQSRSGYSSYHFAQKASASAADAANSAADAATSASNAATSETNAANSASAAATSASNAATSEANALSYLNDFKGRYYGAYSSDPAADPLGSPIDTGDVYYNTTEGKLKYWTGSTWDYWSQNADTVDGYHASSFLRSDTGEMNLSGITFFASSGNRIIKSIGLIGDTKTGLILFAKVYSGTILPKQGFVGKLFVDRGGAGAYNISFEYDVVCTTAYDRSTLTLTGNHPNCYLVKVNYNGEDYYGVYSQATSSRKIILDGFIYDYNLDGNGNPYIFIPDASGYTVTKVDSTQIYNNQNQVYTQNNIVGTVSQSGGVPTGAIIERGSNANGEYIKFADGTIICTQARDISGLNILNGEVYSELLSFPASLIGSIYKSVSGFAYISGYVNLFLTIDMVRLQSEASWLFKVKNTSTNVMTGVYVYLQAIGRWY